MISKWQWIFIRLTRKLWLRAALFACLGIFSALISIFLKDYLPWEISTKIGADAVDGILHILASSMLAVTTFSLSVMVAAYASATSNVSPRATRLLMEDTTTQNVLATFIGSFLYSLVGIIALSTGLYGERGRIILFLVTLVVIGYIVFTIIKWVDHLSRLGRVGETINLLEVVVSKALNSRAENPYLGGLALDNNKGIPPSAEKIFFTKVGYVQHIDMKKLSDYAENTGCKLYITGIPGTFLHPGIPAAYISNRSTIKDDKQIIEAFSVDDTRTYDQDPRFGLSVLSEVASKALSASINDPGTAIDVIGRSIRLFSGWIDKRKEVKPEKYKNIFVKPLILSDMFDDIFTPIARDGAGMIEVQIRLQKAFLALASMGDSDFKESSAKHSVLALQRAKARLTLEEDIMILESLSAKIKDLCNQH